jgi:hypothetical protein
LIPTPIRQVLLTFQTNGVQALLMGGQACVFYGAAQVSKGVDFVLLAEPGNYARLQTALEAARIAVPRFDPVLLARGHAVHFRCAAPGVEGLRVDIMTRLRDLADLPTLWERRTAFADDAGAEFHLELAARFPAETRTLSSVRPLLTHALAGDLDALRPALDAEVRVEQAKDRAYWAPLRRELEALRHEREW